MKINQVVILKDFAQKIQRKHQIDTDEICEVFQNQPNFRKLEKGDILGEDVFGAYGRTNSGRYLSVFFVYKFNQNALIISARNMNKSERKKYAKK
ncbi:MAG: BrnT family toxin [bacterium]